MTPPSPDQLSVCAGVCGLLGWKQVKEGGFHNIHLFFCSALSLLENESSTQFQLLVQAENSLF